MSEILAIILSLVFSVVNSSPAVVTMVTSDKILPMPSPKITGKVIDVSEVKVKDNGIEMPELKIGVDRSEKPSEKENDPDSSVPV